MERFHSREQHLCKFIGKLSFPEEGGLFEEGGLYREFKVIGNQAWGITARFTKKTLVPIAPVIDKKQTNKQTSKQIKQKEVTFPYALSSPTSP